MSSTKARPLVITLAMGFMIVILFIGLVLLEGASHIFLTKVKGWKGAPQFFYDHVVANSHDKNQGLAPGYGALDPHLGYAHGDSFPPKEVDERLKLKRIPGFVVYGDENDPDATKIVALGSSTTDPTTFLLGDHGPDNWPKVLNDLCHANGKKCVVYNGGIGGFTSSQELLKFIRDVLPLKPDVVISLDGGNELYHYSSKFPFTHHYQLRLMEQLVGTHQHHLKGYFPNTIFIMNYLLNKRANRFPIHQGTPYELHPAKIWSMNTRTMNAIANEYGIKYYVFLQPIVGVGKYINSPSDDEYIKTMEDKEQYLTYLTALYSQAIDSCSANSYCINLTGIFDGKKDMFADPRHPNRQGDQLIANEIYRQLELRNAV